MLFLALMYFGWKAARKKTENMIKEERSKKAPAPKKTAKKPPKKAKRIGIYVKVGVDRLISTRGSKKYFTLR